METLTHQHAHSGKNGMNYICGGALNCVAFKDDADAGEAVCDSALGFAGTGVNYANLAQRKHIARAHASQSERGNIIKQSVSLCVDTKETQLARRARILKRVNCAETSTRAAATKTRLTRNYRECECVNKTRTHHRPQHVDATTAETCGGSQKARNTHGIDAMLSMSCMWQHLLTLAFSAEMSETPDEMDRTTS